MAPNVSTRISAGQKTKWQILEAALSVIDLEGVDAVTHRRVGLAAGLSHGVVSYHFPTRIELIEKSFIHHLGSIEDYGEQIQWPEADALSAIQIVDALVRLVAEDLGDTSAIRIDTELVLYGTRNPELEKHHNAWLQSGIDRLAENLKSSGYKKSDQLAHGLINLVRGFLLECLARKSLTEHDFRTRVELLFGLTDVHGNSA